MFLVILTCGLIAEDWGARIERYFDERLTKEVAYKHHIEEWFDYLRLAFDKEPVGHRYLRTLVLRLKFELGMTVASVPVALGTFFIKIPCIWHLIALFIVGGLFLYFLLEAKSSNKALSDLRREMLKKNWG